MTLDMDRKLEWHVPWQRTDLGDKRGWRYVVDDEEKD